MTSLESPREPARRWPFFASLTAFAIVLVLGGLITARGTSNPFEFDEAWMQTLLGERTPQLTDYALALNFLGGGPMATLIAVILVIILCVIKRYWAAGYLAASVALSAALVQILKTFYGRERPAENLVESDFGSFPSGHVANAATLAVVLCIILGGAWWTWSLATLCIAAMMISRMYLGAHWLSDTLGGMVLGIGIALLVWTPLGHRLSREASSRRMSD